MGATTRHIGLFSLGDFDSCRRTSEGFSGFQPAPANGPLPRCWSKAYPLPPPPEPKDEPLAFLLGVMNDGEQDPRLRVRAAAAAAQYVHVEKGDGAKKDEAAEAAKEAAKGRFAASGPPRLAR